MKKTLLLHLLQLWQQACFFILLVLRLKRRIQKIILNTLIPLSVAQTTGIHFPAHVILSV